MIDGVRSVLLGTAGLSIAGAVALLLTFARRIRGDEMRIRSAILVAAAAISVQAAHFVEELLTGFPERFPAALGLPAWPPPFFLSFNLFWLVLWMLSLAGLAVRWQPAMFPLWFLSIAGIANGLAHPLLSLREGGYFPGLLTSPLLGVAGVLLLQRLVAITQVWTTNFKK